MTVGIFFIHFLNELDWTLSSLSQEKITILSYVNKIVFEGFKLMARRKLALVPCWLASKLKILGNESVHVRLKKAYLRATYVFDLVHWIYPVYIILYLGTAILFFSPRRNQVNCRSVLIQPSLRCYFDLSDPFFNILYLLFSLFSCSQLLIIKVHNFGTGYCNGTLPIWYVSVWFGTHLSVGWYKFCNDPNLSFIWVSIWYGVACLIQDGTAVHAS